MRYVRLIIDIGIKDDHIIWTERKSLHWWVWLDVKQALMNYMIGNKRRLVSIEEISKKEFLAKRKKK